MEEAAIGDFSRPLVRREPATVDKIDSAEAKLAAEAKKLETSLKPLTSYEDQLKEVGVSNEKAAEIVDAVLMQGFYSELIPITARLKVRFRTRSYRDSLRLQHYLERVNPNLQIVFGEIINRYNLAASLESMGTSVFKFPDKNTSAEDVEKLFDDRLSFIQGLSETAVNVLFQKLQKFDRKVFVCTQEGAIENF